MFILHDLFLLADAFFMNIGDKLKNEAFAQAMFYPSPDILVTDFIPSVILKDGDIVFLLKFSNIPRNLHSAC